MRTDDFSEIKPQETSDGIPDVVQAEEADSFEDFDGQPSGGKTLGELFRDNPFVKIGLVAVGAVVVVTAFVMFGGGSGDENKSNVGMKINQREAPGQETSQAYTDAINDVNQQRYEQALNSGGSTMPIPTSTPDAPQAPQPEAPPVTIEDPLAGWRSTSQNTPPQQPSQIDPLPPAIPPDANGQYPTAPYGTPIPQGPDPAAVDALAQAMQQQMNGILQKHQISGSQIIQVTDAKAYLQPEGSGGEDGRGGADEQPEIVEILVPAGTIVYAQTLTEANSDAPGPVLARISNGPLKGSRILGTFDTREEVLTLNFNTVVVKGVSQSINAIAIDPATTLPAVATEVDHRYWKRFVLPAAARFIQGMGDAIAQREQTVTVNNGTTVSSTPDLDTKQELAAGLAEGTSEIADQLDNIASQTRVLVKVHAGTSIGILFLEPVLKEN